MNKFKIVGAAAILSPMFATPVFAQGSYPGAWRVRILLSQ